MPVQIGKQTHNFGDPTGLLSDCHRRIEMFLRTLEVVARVIERPPSEETTRALETALRYFGQAAPKHIADEEESLFPRLRQIRNPEIVDVLSRMSELEAEHRWAAPLHAEVERLGEKYLSTGNLSGAEVQEFRNSIARLSSMYERHISIEDDLVFPLAARALSGAEKAAVAQEMASRRNAPLVGDIAEIQE